MPSTLRTGRVLYQNLIQINIKTGLPTGKTKINVITDSDYVPPFIDNNICSPGTVTNAREFSDEFAMEYQ